MRQHSQDILRSKVNGNLKTPFITIKGFLQISVLQGNNILPSVNVIKLKGAFEVSLLSFFLIYKFKMESNLCLFGYHGFFIFCTFVQA